MVVCTEDWCGSLTSSDLYAIYGPPLGGFKSTSEETYQILITDTIIHYTLDFIGTYLPKTPILCFWRGGRQELLGIYAILMNIYSGTYNSDAAQHCSELNGTTYI